MPNTKIVMRVALTIGHRDREKLARAVGELTYRLGQAARGAVMMADADAVTEPEIRLEQEKPA